jgi:hypothetical protein
MSYDGHLGFGLLGDFDSLPELENIRKDLEWAIDSLARAAGVRKRSAKKAPTPRKTARRASSDGAATVKPAGAS